MNILMPALCQQGQVYSNYWLSTIECLQQSQKHNAEVYRNIEASIRNQIAQMIPGFDPANPEHQKRVNESMGHPANQKLFQDEYGRQSITLSFYALSGETLLARARNHAAQVGLVQNFDKILFIDADEGFSWNDVVTLVKAPYPIAAGLVPLKTFIDPSTKETPLNFLPFIEDEVFFDDSLRTLKSTLRLARAKKSEWIRVAFTGTGFLCVDMEVFRRLAETSDEYIYPNPVTRMPDVHWSFFDGGPMDDRYYSEDWAFIGKCRDIGYECMVNVNVRANHTGPYTFTA